MIQRDFDDCYLNSGRICCLNRSHHHPPIIALINFDILLVTNFQLYLSGSMQVADPECFHYEVYTPLRLWMNLHLIDSESGTARLA